MIVVVGDSVPPPVTVAVQVKVYDWPAVKGPVGGVMEAVTVGAAVEMKSGMNTRMSQDAQMCVCKQLWPQYSLCASCLFIVTSSIFPKCLHTDQTKLSL